MPTSETTNNMKESVKISRRNGPSRDVEFAIYVPDAQKVYIAGKFNDWNTQQQPMKKSKNGFWKVKIKLPPGTHEYKYFVDSAWAQDVAGATLVPNSFGTNNCVIFVK